MSDNTTPSIVCKACALRIDICEHLEANLFDLGHTAASFTQVMKRVEALEDALCEVYKALQKIRADASGTAAERAKQALDAIDGVRRS